MSLRLIIEDDEGATTIVPLGKDAITIGRQQGNTIQLTEKNVSRRHARLFQESETWVIEDLNSYNGVKVNDRPVEGRMSLREGDIVQIGDYHLAITEDVDKSTLNYDRQGRAANDQPPPVGEPLLASSSADLPRLSPEEIHALQSGPQQITPAPQPALMDSGPVPATAYMGYQEPEPRKGAGMLIGFGIVVLGALGLGVFWLATTGNEPDRPVATSGGGAASKAAPTEPEQALAKTDELPTPPAADPGDEGAAAVDSAGAAVVDDGAAVPPGDAGEEPAGDEGEPLEVEPEPEPEPIKQPATTKARPKKDPKSPTTTKKDPKPPPPPPESGPSADELLADARKKALTSPGEAYNLAKKSNELKRSQQALSLMCSSACKMGDAGKAQSAYSKLRGQLKTDAQAFCAKKGINL
jgi:pSer/pThr/pTyr-binding forkhead associated (FHA) protein/outer membrane biosynthesis protein TonB